MIDSATKDRILEAAQIVDVVSEFVTLRKRGVNYVGLCPFHADKNPSFYVSPAKNLCKCFACGEGGSPVYFIMKHEQLSYPDALRYLAKKYHIEIRERELTDDELRAQSDRESMFILNTWAQKYFTSCLMEHEEGRTIGLSYFAKRRSANSSWATVWRRAMHSTAPPWPRVSSGNTSKRPASPASTKTAWWPIASEGE